MHTHSQSHGGLPLGVSHQQEGLPSARSLVVEPQSPALWQVFETLHTFSKRSQHRPWLPFQQGLMLQYSCSDANFAISAQPYLFKVLPTSNTSRRRKLDRLFKSSVAFCARQEDSISRSLRILRAFRIHQTACHENLNPNVHLQAPYLVSSNNIFPSYTSHIPFIGIAGALVRPGSVIRGLRLRTPIVYAHYLHSRLLDQVFMPCC